jgi:hypothetical protein
MVLRASLALRPHSTRRGEARGPYSEGGASIEAANRVSPETASGGGASLAVTLRFHPGQGTEAANIPREGRLHMERQITTCADLGCFCCRRARSLQLARVTRTRRRGERWRVDPTSRDRVYTESGQWGPMVGAGARRSRAEGESMAVGRNWERESPVRVLFFFFCFPYFLFFLFIIILNSNLNLNLLMSSTNESREHLKLQCRNNILFIYFILFFLLT